MTTKYYAVKKGRETGIYTSWAECEKQIKGYSGAEYKSFAKKSEANEYMGIKPAKPEIPEPNTKTPSPLAAEVKSECEAVAYVDGSYNVKTGEYAFGAAFIVGDKLYTFSHKYDDAQLAAMHNVAGEIAGAQFAMRYAVQLGLRSLEIIYDYAGIEQWAIGGWKTNRAATKEYAQLYRKLSGQIQIKFKKVKGHSGDLYNDMADRLAKNELGIK